MSRYHKDRSDWYTILSRIMNPLFTREDFDKFLERHKEKIKFYRKHIAGSRILDIGCGFGYTAIPLSNLGYNITALEIDPKILSATRQNVKTFGKNMHLIRADAFSIDSIFRQDSFDACISGGLLEHFKPDEIRELVRKQLILAPVVIADVPIWSDKTSIEDQYLDFEKRIGRDGIYRNLWDRDYWIEDLLKEFNIKYNNVGISSKHTGNFEKLTVVIER